MRAGHHHRPETLLAGMDAALAELVILTPAVLAREERPFQTLFPAPAHTSPSSGGFFCGAGLSGAFRSAHSCFVSSRCSRMEGFFSGVALHVSFWAFFSSAVRSGFSGSTGTDAICPPKLANSSGRLNCSVYIRIMPGGRDAKLSGHGPTTRKAPATIS